MLNVSNYGNSGKLGRTLEPEDTVLVLNGFNNAAFAVPAGDYYYLTLREAGRREVVRVTSAAGASLSVERAQDGTTAQRFTSAACLKVEWNPAQLREFLANAGSGTADNITPGVYCLTCNTCITVNSAGNITAINGSENCNG